MLMRSRITGTVCTGSDVGEAKTHRIGGRPGEAGASRGRATRPAGGPSRLPGDTVSALRPVWLPLRTGGGSRPRPGVLLGGDGRPRQDGAGLRAAGAQGERRGVDRQLPFGASTSGGDLGTQPGAAARGRLVRGGIGWRQQRRIRARLWSLRGRRISRFVPTTFVAGHARRSWRFSATCCWMRPGVEDVSHE